MDDANTKQRKEVLFQTMVRGIKNFKDHVDFDTFDLFAEISGGITVLFVTGKAKELAEIKVSLEESTRAFLVNEIKKHSDNKALDKKETTNG